MIERACESVAEALRLAIEEKGQLSFAGPHEALGVLTEEVREFEDAVRIFGKDPKAEDQIAVEAQHIAVVALWTLASIYAAER